MNFHLPQTLSDLLHYGSSYLDCNELEQQLSETIKAYHRFLAVNYLFGSRGSEFWDYHKGRLRELGYPLTHVVLLKAAVLIGLQESVNPGQAIGKLRKRVFPAGTEGDAGTTQSSSAVNGSLPSNGIE